MPRYVDTDKHRRRLGDVEPCRRSATAASVDCGCRRPCEPWSSTRPGPPDRPTRRLDRRKPVIPHDPWRARAATSPRAGAPAPRRVHRHQPVELARSASTCACSACHTRCQVPSRDHLVWRLHAVSHGPNPSGRSRHGAPVGYFHTIVSTPGRDHGTSRPACRMELGPAARSSLTRGHLSVPAIHVPMKADSAVRTEEHLPVQ